MTEFLKKINRVKYQIILSTIVILGVLGFDYMFFIIEIPEANKDIANAAFGALNTIGFTTVMNFWFGNSFKKDEPKDEKQE